MTSAEHRAAALAALIIGTFAASAAEADHPGFAGGAGTAGPVITVPATTLPKGKLAMAVRVSYLKPDGLSDLELETRASHHIHAHDAEYLFSPSLSVAYGVTDELTLAFSLPYVHRDDLREGTHEHDGGTSVNGVEELGSSSGLGDAMVLAQYRIAGDEHAPWQVALLAGVKLPTGATHVRTQDAERFETEHQPGTGSWDPLLGLAATRRLERVSLDANVLYQFATEGAQATRLGDRVQYNLSFSYRIGGEHHHEHGGDDADHHEAHGPQLDLILELNGEWEGRQKVAGAVEEESGGHVLYLSPGIRLIPSEGWSASLSLGLPVLQHIRLSHPENDYRLVAGIARAF